MNVYTYAILTREKTDSEVVSEGEQLAALIRQIVDQFRVLAVFPC